MSRSAVIQPDVNTEILGKKNHDEMKLEITSEDLTWFNVSSESGSPKRRYSGAFNPVRFCQAPWKSLEEIPYLSDIVRCDGKRDSLGHHVDEVQDLGNLLDFITA